MWQERRSAGSLRDETARLLALRESRLVESGTDLMLDAVVLRAAMLFNVPIAWVNLHDGARRACRSSIGLGLPFTDRELTSCAEPIAAVQPIYLLNARTDSRFAGSDVVQGQPGIRFIAWAPVYGPEQQRFGALCVMDRRARPSVEAHEMTSLQAMAMETAAIFATSVIEPKPERPW